MPGCAVNVMRLHTRSWKVVQRKRCECMRWRTWIIIFYLHHLSKQLTLAVRSLSWRLFFWWLVRALVYGPKLIKSGFSCAGTTTLGEILASKQIGAHSFVLQMRGCYCLCVFLSSLSSLFYRAGKSLFLCLYVVQL